MHATGKGPIQAVRHFWDPAAKVKTHPREYQLVYSWHSTERARKKPRKPAKQPKAAAAPPPEAAVPLDALPLDKLRAEIAHTRAIREAMAADHSWSAWAMVSRYLRQLEEAEAALQTEQSSDFDPHDDEAVVAAVLALPRRILDDDRVRAAVLDA
jgi:hypothetical protein